MGALLQALLHDHQREREHIGLLEDALLHRHERCLAPRQGDLLAVLSAGAYCMSMASNYNSRGRAPEVLVDGEQTHLIRRRETIAEQMQQEQLVGH